MTGLRQQRVEPAGRSAGARARSGAAGPPPTSAGRRRRRRAAASKCSVPNRSAIWSMTALTWWARRASGLASTPGMPSIRPGSGSRMVSTSAPAARSAPMVCAAAAAIRSGSKFGRRVSLTPITTLAISGRSASALRQLVALEVGHARAVAGDDVQRPRSGQAVGQQDGPAAPAAAALAAATTRAGRCQSDRIADPERDRIAKRNERRHAATAVRSTEPAVGSTSA